jgi:hypothetical protein
MVVIVKLTIGHDVKDSTQARLQRGEKETEICMKILDSMVSKEFGWPLKVVAVPPTF